MDDEKCINCVHGSKSFDQFPCSVCDARTYGISFKSYFKSNGLRDLPIAGDQVKLKRFVDPQSSLEVFTVSGGGTEQ